MGDQLCNYYYKNTCFNLKLGKQILESQITPASCSKQR